MLSIPIPYFSALLLVLLLALLLRQRGDMRTMVFVAITAAMAGLVGLRWSFPHLYLWLAVALISSVQAPCAWLCFYRPQAGAAALSGRVGVALPFFSAILTWVLFWSGERYWNWIEVWLVVLYMGYGGALLGLGWGMHAQFDAVRFSQVPDIRQAAIWAGWVLIFNGVVEGLVGLDYWLYQGRHAPWLVGLAHLVLLPALMYGVVRAGQVFAYEKVVAPLAPVAPSPVADDANGLRKAAVAKEQEAGALQSATASTQTASADDAAVLAQLTELVCTQGLFRGPDLSLIKLARRMGIPARDLSALVNRQCGKNIAQWINGFRIAAACDQLAAGDAPITTIMLDCGFFTKSNFHREFRRHTGLSPSAYRQHARKQAGTQTCARPVQTVQSSI